MTKSEKARAYRQQHYDQIRAREKAYRQQHPDRRRSAERAYRKRHRDRECKRAKKYRETHRARRRAIEKAYRDRHRGLVRARIAARRALKQGVAARLVDLAAIMARDRGRCYWCKRRVGPRLKPHFDHVLALSKGGAHTVDNIVLSCWRCNLSKKDRPWSLF